jgi:hypothetical protein
MTSSFIPLQVSCEISSTLITSQHLSNTEAAALVHTQKSMKNVGALFIVMEGYTPTPSVLYKTAIFSQEN